MSLCRTPQLVFAFIAVGLILQCATLFAEEAQPRPPESDVDPLRFWQGKRVVQTRGFVLDFGDADHIVRKRYWVLAEAAMGRVVSVSKVEQSCDVEFASAVGWEQRGFAVREVRAEEWEVEKDSYGVPIRVRKSELVREGIQVEHGDHGILKEVRKDDSRLVRFPLQCIGLAPLRLGDEVNVGPDLAVLGPRWMQGDTGRVIALQDADRYIGVEWKRTGRQGRYRYDCHRYYDVLSTDP